MSYYGGHDDATSDLAYENGVDAGRSAYAAELQPKLREILHDAESGLSTLALVKLAQLVEKEFADA